MQKEENEMKYYLHKVVKIVMNLIKYMLIFSFIGFFFLSFKDYIMPNFSIDSSSQFLKDAKNFCNQKIFFYIALIGSFIYIFGIYKRRKVSFVFTTIKLVKQKVSFLMFKEIIVFCNAFLGKEKTCGLLN